jgi:hypothetical protein
MREEDLLDLIDRAAIEELTPEQCAAIRGAAEASAVVRRACLERIGLEEHLAATLGRPRVSIDDLLAGRRRVVESRFAGGWLAPLLIGLLLATVVGMATWLRRRGRDAEPAAGGTPVVADLAAIDTAPKPPDGAEPQPAHPRGGAAPPAAAEPAANELPAGPWTKTLAADAADPTAAGLFSWLPPRQIDPIEFAAWFRAPADPTARSGKASSTTFKTDDTRRLATAEGSGRLLTMTGTAALVPPLRAGTALRLLVYSPDDLRIVGWSGDTGAVIEREGPKGGPRWSASVLTRPAPGQPAAARWLASTSDGRGHRSGAGFAPGRLNFFGVLELRHENDALVLSRGEVRLAEAPLPGPPDEVVFEGAMTIGGIELVKAVPPRPLPQPLPISSTWRPANRDWIGSGAAAVEKRPDGSVRLAQREAAPKTPLVATWKVPPAQGGPREIVLRIADYTPGTGICISGTDGKPALVCGFVDPAAGGPPDRRGSLFMTWTPDKSPLVGGDPKDLGLAFAPPAPWLRLTPVGAALVVSWSHDGTRWARLRTFPAIPQGIAEIGLFAGAHPGRSITLAEAAAADMPGFAAVLPRDLADAVTPAVAAATGETRIEGWQQKMLAAKPAAVDEGRWLAAAAIRCLATQPTVLSMPLCQLIWRHAESLDLPLDGRLAVCDDINRLTTALSRHDATPLSGIYGVVARGCVDRGDVAGFERVWLRLQEAPSDLGEVLPFDWQVDPLAVCDRFLRRLTGGGLDAATRAVLTRLRFYANDTGLAAVWARAAEQGSPVVIDQANAVANVMAEFEAAIEPRAWADAQRSVAGLAAAGGDALHQLLEDRRDPDRLVTMPTVLGEAVAANADFAAFMQGDPAARGRLRVAQLRAAGDADGMASAAVEFQATPAAAEARAWLAQRHLAAGDFLAARKHATIGLESAAPEQRDGLVSIRALAEALAGLAVSAPPRTGIGGLPAAEVAALVAAAVERRGADVPFTSDGQAGSSAAPAPADLEAVKRADLGPAAQGAPAVEWPKSIVSPVPPAAVLHRLDWSAEVCTLTPVGASLLASNRQEIVAIDAATGVERWRVPAGEKPSDLRTYSLVPLRPVCDATHAYVRRLPAPGVPPGLAAIRLADGAITWQVAPDPAAPIVSDPVLLEGVLWACEIRSEPLGDDPRWAFGDELSLVAFDRRTGARRFVRPLAGLQPAWRTSLRGRPSRDVGDCQLAVAEGRLVVTVGGSVICCGNDGHPLWVRRQPWAGTNLRPGPQDPWNWWWFQAQTPALARDGRLYVVQPGVAACAAIELADGRLAWRTPLPLVRRLVGIAGTGDASRVVVETGDGIVALDLRDGAPQTLLDGRDGPGDPWLGEKPTRLMAAALATADGHAIVAVQRRRPPVDTSGTLDTSVLWIDAVSGTVKRTVDLPALAGRPPWVGPLAATADRLWVLTAPDPADLRRTLWSLEPKR